MLVREDGQILPGLVLLLVFALSLGVLFFQVGKASVLRSDAQNAADAAALAGAKEIQRQLQAQWATLGYTSPAAIDVPKVEAEMAKYARENDGVVVDSKINVLAVDVKVWTASERELGEAAAPARSEDFKATARARAQVGLGPFSPGDSGAGAGITPGAVAPGDVPRISEQDWKELERKIGPGPRDCPDVITLGLLFVKRGFSVWQNEHPALGGDAGHEDKPYSPHHDCNGMGALDVNFGPPGDLVPVEVRAVDPLIAPLQRLGYSTIWRDGGEHDNHLHVDISSGNIGAGTDNLGGFTGPLAHTSLEVRLVDWEKPVEALVELGGAWPTTSSLSGPPDPQIMALMCQMAKPLGDKILLALFETAIVESGIHNLNWGSEDSHGYLQQQFTQNWGTLQETMHPPTATRMFLEAAVEVARENPGLSAGQLAAVVQRPREDLRGLYEEVKGQAQALIARAC